MFLLFRTRCTVTSGDREEGGVSVKHDDFRASSFDVRHVIRRLCVRVNETVMDPVNNSAVALHWQMIDGGSFDVSCRRLVGDLKKLPVRIT